jgi:hypothetical protein
MKKLLTALSALAMVTTMAVPAFAASNTVKEGNYTLAKTVVSVNGKTAYEPYVFAAKDPNSGVMTTFIPIWYIMQVMKGAGITNTWNGNSGVLTLSGKSGSLSIHGAHGHSSIVLNGKTVESGVPNFAVKDPNSGKLTTFFGLYYAEKMLDAMGLANTWNGTKHVWTLSVANNTNNKKPWSITVTSLGKLNTSGGPVGKTYGGGTVIIG